ncbi:hypothetical protein AVEN_244305-1 [Araneus ventricosus]|uniref:STPR domain-containing protein n=1 Tax=Araneus ventricosus TaxID=182803 RepID=A0A4Y2HQS1_ARAVE|nr:hypothetical protein AVEN_244305-1 [Araneus ventricosus]
MLPVDSRQLRNVKKELLQLTKKETADFQLWQKVSRTEETEEQNNSLLTVMAKRGQKRRAEEDEELRNRGLSDMTQRGQERKAEETDEQRNIRVSDMVHGSIGISNIEETVTKSRENSIAKEESALEKASRRRAIEKTAVWKTFKSIVFLICLIFLIIQSVEFFSIYYKYPTTIVTEVTVAKEVKLPAITLCFRTTISFKEFCSYEPYWCEMPRNMKDFCRKHDFDCREGRTYLKIPMQDYSTKLRMQLYLFNDSYNDAQLFREYDYASKARTFIEASKNDHVFLKCYSDNLHLYQSRSKPETRKFDFKESDIYKNTIEELSPFVYRMWETASHFNHSIQLLQLFKANVQNNQIYAPSATDRKRTTARVTEGVGECSSLFRGGGTYLEPTLSWKN